MKHTLVVCCIREVGIGIITNVRISTLGLQVMLAFLPKVHCNTDGPIKDQGISITMADAHLLR